MTGASFWALARDKTYARLWSTQKMEVPMALGYINERLFRSTHILQIHLGNLRERLADAYAKGFSEVGVSEMAVFGHDIQNQFSTLKERMTAIRIGGYPDYDASIAEMSDDEVVSTANLMLEIKRTVGDAIASGRILQ
jgi:hypothetical protein